MQKSSIKIRKIHGLNGYEIGFKFDSTVPCQVKFYWVVKETCSNLDGYHLINKDDTPAIAQTFGPFPPGLDQSFALPSEMLFNPDRYNPRDMTIDSVAIDLFENIPLQEVHDDDDGPVGYSAVEMSQQHTQHDIVYPLVIVIESVPSFSIDSSSSTNIHCQSTFITTHSSSDGVYDLKVLKQKMLIEGTPYLLQEIFGVGDESEGLANNQKDSCGGKVNCVDAKL